MKPIKKLYHLVGIKGVAMTALATYLLDDGNMVSGSDVSEVFPTDEVLAVRKIPVYQGFDGNRLINETKPDIVYYTGAHNGRNNEEVQAAIKHNIPVSPHAEALGKIAGGKRQIVVAGSHGKTTTSAMIAMILTKAKFDPSYAVGCGEILGLKAAGHKGNGEWFVLEGDEYVTDPGHDKTPRFLWLSPEILVVSNIDYDHPDVYENKDAVVEAFIKLQNKKVGLGLTVLNADDSDSAPLLNAGGVVTYGFSENADITISKMRINGQKIFFTLRDGTVDLGEFSIGIPGKHNVLNATAAAIAASRSGVSWDHIREGLSDFSGTRRRFEKIGEKNNVVFIDDYAHHPAEIAATLSAAKGWYPNSRIISVFQPHTFTRTRALQAQFALAFSDASVAILTDIYASAREKVTNENVIGDLFSETSKFHPNVLYKKNKDMVAATLQKILTPGDVVIFMGAGDIYTWGKEIAENI